MTTSSLTIRTLPKVSSDFVMTMEYGPALCTTNFLLKRNKSTRIIYDPINDIIEDKRT